MDKQNSYYNALPTGYRLEQYQIIKVLGAGGFGIAYLAKDTRLDTQVVLKEYLPNEISVREQSTSRVLLKDSSSHEDYELGLKEYIKEARTIAKFDHPNIVQVKNYIEANNTAYIVMNYIEGSNLSELAQGETATEEEIRHILLPLLEGLKEVHEHGYLHRDIKPSNIFIQHKSRKPILIDFGAARFNLGVHSKSITSIVTPGYSPYEQYYSKGHQGAWTDIYALGAVLYRLISGNPPPEAPARIMAKEENGSDPLIPAIEVGKNKYSLALLRAIDAALVAKPSQRPQTIQAFQDILLESETIFDKNESKSELKKKNKKEPKLRKSKSLIFSVLIILCAVTIGGWWINYQAKETQNQFDQIVNQERIEDEQKRRQRKDDNLYAQAKEQGKTGLQNYIADCDLCSHKQQAQNQFDQIVNQERIEAEQAKLKKQHFVKLDHQGQNLPDLASTWASVKDNHTGLIWEVKTKSNDKQGDHLHDADDRYTWYSTDNTINGGSQGYADKEDNRECDGYQVGKASSYCNTQAYTARVNAENYGGFNDWRMPEREELRSLFDYSRENPAINTDYFPNTRSSWFWSRSPLAGNPDKAWGVGFSSGGDGDGNGSRSSNAYVRLVRGGQ